MDESAERTRVEWREWGERAFDAADRAGKPVLCSLSATWCAHCHEMDRETYDDPRIAANVNDGFVPIRVDVDRQPRVRERYNMGGFPSTVFLTPSGRVLSGAGYLGPDGFRDILTSVRRAWDGKGEDAGSVPRAIRDGTPPGGDLTPEIERQMHGQLVDAFDETNGGWGDGAKFPLPRTVEFALKRERDQATRTLDAIDANLRDTYAGGFYRFAENPDWSDTHHEKLLDANAALVRAFANAYLYTGSDTYRAAAHAGIEYLTGTLWTGDAFAGSQAAAADPEYYVLEPSEREARDQPAVDATVFADRNALAADALLAYAGYTDDERARRYGERALDFVREHCLGDDGAVTHYRPIDGDDEDAAGDQEGDAIHQGVLADQARVLGALARARQVTGASVLADARAVADWTIDALATADDAGGDAGTDDSDATADGAGGDAGADGSDATGAADSTATAPLVFRDGPRDGAGLLSDPLYPVDGNVEMADALLDLAVLTGEDRYRRVGRRALESFAGAADRFGVRVAAYASTASRYLESPLVVATGNEAGSDLHRAALRVADHEKIVVPNASAVDAGIARVRRGDDVAGTASTPAELAELVAATV